MTRAHLAQRFSEDVASLVAEVTDDKSLLKEERKTLQVQSAGGKSDRAKMIKVADMVSNLRSLATSPPKDWTEDRKQEYVIWSAQVVAGCSGISPWLEAVCRRVQERSKQETRKVRSGQEKWPRLFEQLSPIYKWTPGGLLKVPKGRFAQRCSAYPVLAASTAPR